MRSRRESMAEGGARIVKAPEFGETLREDSWWAETIPVVLLLGGFGLYATLRAFEGRFYEWGPYLSPFYSPLIDEHHRWWKLSPALLILGGPLGFRATCYTTARRIIARFFRIRPRARLTNGRGTIRARRSFRSFCKICTGIFCILRCCSWSFCGRTRFKRSFSTESSAWA